MADARRSGSRIDAEKAGNGDNRERATVGKPASGSRAFDTRRLSAVALAKADDFDGQAGRRPTVLN
jgi:hypothetical protein